MFILITFPGTSSKSTCHVHDISWPCVLLSVHVLSFCKTLLIVMLIIFTVCSQDGSMSMRCLSWKMRSIYACFTCHHNFDHFLPRYWLHCPSRVQSSGDPVGSNFAVKIQCTDTCLQQRCSQDQWFTDSAISLQNSFRRVGTITGEILMELSFLGVGIWRPLRRRTGIVVIYTSNPV